MPDFMQKMKVHAIKPEGFVRLDSDEPDEDGDGWGFETDETFLMNAARVAADGPVVVTCTDGYGVYRWSYLANVDDPERYDGFVGGTFPHVEEVPDDLYYETTDVPEGLPKKAMADLALAITGEADADAADFSINRWQSRLVDAKAWRRFLKSYMKGVESPADEVFAWRDPGPAGRHFIHDAKGEREVALRVDDETGAKVAAFVPGVPQRDIFVALHFGDPKTLVVKFPEVVPQGEQPPERTVQPEPATTKSASAGVSDTTDSRSGGGGFAGFLKRLWFGDD